MHSSNKRLLIGFILACIFLFNIGIPVYGEQLDNTNGEISAIPVRAKVTKIISEESKTLEGYGEKQTMKVQKIEVKVLSGKHKGEILLVENVIDDRFAYNIIVDDNDKVLLYLDKDENGEIIEAYIGDKVRDTYLLWIAAIFIILLIIVGGIKGLKTVITLLLTIIAVFKIFIPMTLKGYNPIFLSISICFAVTMITLIIIGGINKKTLASIIGTTGGVLVAGIITLIVGTLADLTGLGTDEAQMLMFIPQAIDFNFKGLLFAGIILGALGAVMDVSMSISSSINELKENNPYIETRKLIESGMNVGKDIMGTMSNTLILAYTGGSLHLMLLFLAYDIPFIEIINRDIIASEIVRALAGSIGLICTIPLTVIVASTIINKE